MKTDRMIDYNIRSAWSTISRMYNCEAAKHDMSLSSASVLLNIDVKNGTPSTSLGPKMGLEPRSLTRMIKKLESRNFIYRRSSDIDKRVVLICLTEEGIKAREIAKKNVFQLNEAVIKNVLKKDLDSFYKVIDIIQLTLNNQNVFT